MGLATRGRSRARSTTDQKPSQKLTIKIGNVLHKSFRFIPEAVCFKSSVPLLYSPEQHRQRCPLHPWTFPSRECGGVLSVPENQKRVGQWWGWPHPLCPSRNACSGLWWADRGRLTWLAGFMAKRVKWPNNDRREALGTRLHTIDPTELPHLQDASPLGSGSFPRFSLCWLTAGRRPSV